MTEPQDGTFSKLMEIAESAPDSRKPAPGTPVVEPVAKPSPSELAAPAAEDLSTIPYISQNYRFTDDELRWLRRSALDFSEQSGIKVSQNTILRVALRELRDACDRNAKSNPLIRAIFRLKK